MNNLNDTSGASAVKFDPHSPSGWSNLGAALLSQSRDAEAIGCFEKSLEFDPRFGVAWSIKGNSFVGLCRYDDAISYHDKALELDKSYVRAWYDKARVEDQLGHSTEAAASYREFLALATGQEYAKEIECASKRLLAES
jgi:tetratricopeptide (TPR) repeat protein